jgi:uncharacterized protein (TIGR03067 family)
MIPSFGERDPEGIPLLVSAFPAANMNGRRTQVTAIEAAGKPIPTDRVQKINHQYIFDRDKVTVHGPDRPDNTSTFTIDGTTSPKKMTINQVPATRAVYAIEANKLRLCLMVDENPNAGYPTELASKAFPKTDLLTLERR